MSVKLTVTLFKFWSNNVGIILLYSQGAIAAYWKHLRLRQSSSKNWLYESFGKLSKMLVDASDLDFSENETG